MKKVLSRLLTVVSVAFLTIVGYQVSYTFASTIPEFTIGSSWSDISDSTRAGYWSGVAMVQCNNLSSSFSVNSYVNTAAKKWSVVEGVECSFTTSSSLANSTFYSGTKTQLKAVGFSYLSNTLGLTEWNSYLLKKQDTGHLYKLYNILEASASVCTDGSYGSCEYSDMSSSLLTMVYNHLVLHEMGHLLGYAGHSCTSTYTQEVMYAYESIVYSLKENDIEHLTYVYSLAD